MAGPRFLKLLGQFARMSLLNQLAYPPSWIMAVLGKTIRAGILLIFFHAVFGYTQRIGDWGSNEMLAFVATYLTLEYVVAATFHRNLSYYLPDMLRKAQFDFLLTKPVNPLFYTAARVLDLMDSVTLIPIAALWIVVVSRHAIQLDGSSFGMFLVLFVVGYCMIFFLLLLVTSVVFWSFTSTGIGRLFENALRLARYPDSIYQGGMRIFLVYVLPVAAAVTVPAEALRGTLQMRDAAYLVFSTVVLGVLSLSVWRAALRHYSSASA